MKRKYLLALLVAIALLVTAGAFAVQAETDPAVLNQVNAAAVQMTTDKVLPLSGATVTADCPACGEKNATWKVLSSNTNAGKARGISGHWYLSGDRTSNTGYYIAYEGNACLHLNGFSIKTTSKFALAGAAGYTFNIMGDGNVEAAGSKTNGTVYGQGTVRLFGGTYAATGATSCVVSVVDNANVYMYNGATINGNSGADGAIINEKNATYHLYGGTVNANGGVGLKLTAGTTNLAGVTVNAAGGRGVYLAGSAATVEQSAGSITGATNNNVYMTAGTYTLSGGSITGGKREGNGGNVLIDGGKFNMTGGTISKGTAYNGGNVYITAGTLNMQGGTITEGQAIGGTSNQYYYYGGGNIYVNDNASAVANISGGTVSDGTTTNNSGGNILCRGAGTLTISGGNITGGTAGALGGNIMNGAGANVTISGGTISGGESNTLEKGGRYHGGNIASFGGALTVSGGTIESKGDHVGEGIFACYNATLILDGDAKVTNAGKTGNIFVSNHLASSVTPKLQVKSTFTGEAGVQWNVDYGYGETVASTSATCEGAYTGNLYYEDQPVKPCILGVNGRLVIGTAQLMGKDGTAVWYASNAAAVAAYDNNTEYLMTGATELALPDGSYTVDLAGRSLNITGTGTVTCFDSANDDYSANGVATITGATLANDTMTKVNGKYYVVMGDNGTYTFHRLDMRVTGVSFRPTNAGIYYTCDWRCDETLKNALDSFGVIVSTADMPDETFQDDSMWTASSMDVFENGVAQNSVLIKNIFDAGEDNDLCGKEDIYAVPYVLLGDEYLLPDNGVAYSLYDVLMLLDADEYYFNNVKTLDSFYETWEEILSDWGFENIGQPWGVNPGEDDIVQLLMVGDAFNYYYVEELYGLLAEAGYEAEIYNLYYSGCTLSQHYNWWVNGEANYQLFKTDSTGRNEVKPVSSTRWTLELAMAQGNWDYISLQGASGDRYIEAAENENVLAELCANSSTYAGPLLDQFYKRFPEAGLLWHRTWAFEVGRIDRTTIYTEEMLVKYDAGMQKVCDYMCSTFDEDKEYDLQMVNTGKAWAEARKLNADWIESGNDSLLPAGGLCARLGVANANTYVGAQNGEVNVGDGYHDGDIGGGQLLNAYVWYMTLTGDTDLSDNKYRDPTYTMLDTRASLLKNAAQVAAGFSAGSDMTVGLQIGYGRESITPDYSVNLWSDDWASRVTQTVKDDIYVTCVAIREGEETVLLYTIDTLLVTQQPYYASTAKVRISNATGIPKENILLNATHTHSGVALRHNWTNASKYRTAFYKAAAKAAETAIADLSAANTYAGGTQTEKLAFVRHYTTKDGGVCGANFGDHSSGYTGHVREADQELQLVRFEREGKKDVLLMSFPSHATFYETGVEISADYPGYARSYIEKNEDVLVAFFQGASGDQVPTSRINDEPDIRDCVAYGETLGKYALDALSGLEKVEDSKVKISTKTFEGVTSTHAADKLDGAKAIKSIASEYGPNSAETKAALAEYGFSTYYEALWVTYRANSSATKKMNLRVLSIGDGLGFAIAPYEMFAMHGKQIKEQSPFETTMIITNSEGSMSYLPDENSYDYGAYEAHISWFEKGTAETLVDEFVDMLTQLKGE